MDGHPVASLRRLGGGAAADAVSSSADQREDARMGSAAAISPGLSLGSLLSENTGLRLFSLQGKASGVFEWISIFL